MPVRRPDPLPVPRTASARTSFGRWLQSDTSGGHDDPGQQASGQPASGQQGFGQHGPGVHDHDRHSHPWYTVLWLTGVDYFSTLGYQPGIALLAAGALSPIATGLLVLVTLLGALPIYSQVASRSYAGQGSIAMLESLVPGWFGKLFVLTMLGFAATDFVITITLSSADATQHAMENPLLHDLLAGWRVPLTLGLMGLLALVFLKGFAEAIGVAAFVAIPYLLLNLVVLLRGLQEILARPELVSNWRADLLASHGDWTGMLIASAFIFPKLALGMSGFETGVSVMPLVAGGQRDARAPSEKSGEKLPPPRGRIANTRKLLTAAALIMSSYLLLSSFVTSLLIPAVAYHEGGDAAGRAIAYLAHEFLGHGFGTVYDIVTIAILWFAGASALAGLLNLIPRYLPRFGMAPRWVAHRRPLVLIIFAVCVIVTLIFQADVEAQAGAYATGVLALILSAAVAVALANGREYRKGRGSSKLVLSIYFWIMAGVFAYTLFENVIERPDGLVISSIFILAILTLGGISRYLRATELRVTEIDFFDEESAALWDEMRGKKVNLVPLTHRTVQARRKKAREIDAYYDIELPLAFVHVRLLDNRSEFIAPVKVQVRKEGANYVVDVSGAVAIANTIAYLSELIDPKSIFLGLTRKSLMSQSFRYLLWGEGETGLMVYQILLRYWEWTPEDDVRPLIFLMSE